MFKYKKLAEELLLKTAAGVSNAVNLYSYLFICHCPSNPRNALAVSAAKFIRLGGKPKLPNPYSFTLLECEYLREWFNSSDKIVIDLDDVPDDQVSFTLGDSCALIIHGNEPVVLTKKMMFEQIEACNGSVDTFLKESLGKYAYVEVQLWDNIQI